MFSDRTTEGRMHGCFPLRRPPFGPGQVLGTTVLGERGQVVIPAKFRKELNLNSGDSFFVFGNEHHGMIMLMKSDVFDSFADLLFAQSAEYEELAQSMRSQAEELSNESSDETGSETSGEDGLSDA